MLLETVIMPLKGERIGWQQALGNQILCGKTASFDENVAGGGATSAGGGGGRRWRRRRRRRRRVREGFWVGMGSGEGGISVDMAVLGGVEASGAALASVHLR